MIFFKHLLLIFTAAVAHSSELNFLQRSNSFLSIYHYTKDNFYDSQGNKTTTNDQYKKTDVNLYLNHQSNPNLEFYGNFFISLINDQGHSHLTSSNQEFGSYQKIYEQENGFNIKIGETLSLPLYSSSNRKDLGSKSVDISAKVRLNKTFTKIRNYPFLNFEMGHRLRTGTPQDQVFMSMQIGHRFFPLILQMITLDYINSLNKSQQNFLSRQINDNYSLIKVGTSLLYPFNKRDHIQIGFYQDISAKNSGTGQSLFVSWWRLNQ